MKDANRSPLNEPSTIMHSMMPLLRVMAGKIEYLSSSVKIRSRINVNLPFAPREVLLPACAETFQSPGPIPQIRPSVACTFIYENELFRSVILSDSKTVFGAGQLVALRGMLRDLRTSADGLTFANKTLTSFILNPTLCSVRQMVDSDTYTPHRSSKTSRSSSRYMSFRRVTVCIKNYATL